MIIKEKDLNKDKGTGKRGLCKNCYGEGKYIVDYKGKYIHLSDTIDCKFCKGTGRR